MVVTPKLQLEFDWIRPGPAATHLNQVRASISRLRETEDPLRLGDLEETAKDYVLNDDFATAINTAIHLRAPLLVTGEPGTGKTQVAYHLAWYLDLPLFRFQARSTSTANDLKYDFDAVAYLHHANNQRVALKSRNSPEFLKKGPLWQAFLTEKRSILLLDEIDKAPRDFPNDLLRELGELEFENPFDPELGQEIVRPKCELPPIVIATSNAERRLPDAFLRRCVAYHIDVDETFLKRVVAKRLAMFPSLDESTRNRAIARFVEITGKSLKHKPSTAELLMWLATLSAMGIEPSRLDGDLARLPALYTLLKDPKDFEKLRS